MSKTQETLICPSCLAEFTHEQIHEARKKVAAKLLVEHGFSLREVGKMLGMHQQTVKYWAEKEGGSK